MSPDFWQHAISAAVVGSIPALRSWRRAVRERRAKQRSEGRYALSDPLAYRLGSLWARHKKRLADALTHRGIR